MGPKAKALDKKAQLEEAAALKAQQEREKADAAAWSVGAKDNSKDAAKAAAEAEKLRKAAEKASLLAEEEAMLGGVAKVKAPKKKGKDDFDMLNAALANQPKTKAQKEAEAKKKLLEEQKTKEDEARAAKEARLKAQSDEIKNAAAKGIVMNHTDDLFLHQKSNNRLDDDDEANATGLEGALDVLSGLGGSKAKGEPGQKALYNAYYERELPLLREGNPGLKLSQLKERIFDNWQRSAENPRNQKPKAGATTFFDEPDEECESAL